MHGILPAQFILALIDEEFRFVFLERGSFA
jgi:hypothetical protein